jgi:hypothetical protein
MPQTGEVRHGMLERLSHKLRQRRTDDKMMNVI